MQSYPSSSSTFYVWQALEERIRSMEARISQLEAQVQQQSTDNQALQATIKEVKPIQIGTINYKIQELHVSELSGTLNVGLTAFTDEKEMQKLIGSLKEQGEKQMENMDTTYSNETNVYDMSKLDEETKKENNLQNGKYQNNDNGKQKKSTAFE
ncbi:spore germination protein GerPC [Paenibacillus sp. SC116]|uniref:spore germination protein GerPC n=1 Tax=Paenibacillus sp. SC116 TaxID=2968986 RepID=UPI00215A45AD|nr:spore germination protein GerPC [Paenibacillus sp. SC116]MCR8843897.1 spore germination protein GerPC [Paenibacillus sp. SC116]